MRKISLLLLKCVNYINLTGVHYKEIVLVGHDYI